ncbi:LysR family transcriptional regulator [Altererythrobacter soli]|uniref:LysR family transcriptional regulator n=1 Tax=Croceibacterium soli TaxID=1739690 RepID=A0A6I4UPP5_9SPHN|nr:LysR substrate-binding domain-containing protein [Croceibacterium soli]MXP40940.1 LysR family transcriptional regulator [Croceibacterium soli]
MDRLPPLSAIRAFEAAGRLEHFSRAAEELGMTQAAVSYQVRQLEERIGHPLFVREKGGVRLSEAGQRLLPAVTGAFAEMRQAFAGLDEESTGVLSVSASVSLGATWLSARIGRFQLAFPDLAVRLSLSNDVVDLARGEIDLAIRIGRGDWDGLRSDFLFRSHVTPICSPEFIERHEIRCPEDLLRVERLAPNDPWWAGWFAAAGVAESPAPRRGVVLDSQSQEASAVEAGFGIAMMTPLLWRAQLESGRLVQPFDTLYLPGSSNWLVHKAGRTGVRKIERFREWIQQELSRDADLLPEPLLLPPR